MHKAVFFDKDGVINKLVERSDGRFTSPWTYEELILFPDVKRIISLIKFLGYKTYIVTNQPGIEDGEMRKYDLLEICYNLKKKLKVNRILCATQRNSDWYKPNNGMIEYIINSDNINRSKSFIIGDRWKDIVPGVDSGLITVFKGTEYIVPEEYKEYRPDFCIKNLNEFYNIVIRKEDHIL